LCGLARNFDLLVLLRFFEGIGAASLGALNVTLIGDLYSDKVRSKVMGYNTSVLSIGTAGFPLIGGFLAIFGWYYPFFLALLGLPVGLLTLIYLDETRKPVNLDNRNYFKEAYKYIREKRNLVYFSSNLFSYIILFGSFLTFTPFLVSRIKNNDPLFIGILLSSMSVITALVSSQLGNLLKFTKEETLLKASFILYSVALFLMPFMKNGYFLFIPTVIYGIAQGLNVPSLLSLISAAPPLELRGGFMSFNRMISQLGQTFGPLLMGLVFLLFGLDSVFYFGAVIALTMGSILIIF
jgi:MFS transporter, ACDE family, multidrug resistance protein